MHNRTPHQSKAPQFVRSAFRELGMVLLPASLSTSRPTGYYERHTYLHAQREYAALCNAPAKALRRVWRNRQLGHPVIDLGFSSLIAVIIHADNGDVSADDFAYETGSPWQLHQGNSDVFLFHAASVSDLTTELIRVSGNKRFWIATVGGVPFPGHFPGAEWIVSPRDKPESASPPRWIDRIVEAEFSINYAARECIESLSGQFWLSEPGLDF